jgi:lysine 2,3-aminomutase
MTQRGNQYTNIQVHYLSLEELEQMVKLTDEEKRAIALVEGIFPLKISRHYASLIAGSPPDDPLRKIIIPSLKELETFEDDALLDIHRDEARYQPTEGIIHRYPGKLIFMPTLECLGHCRFCFRQERLCTTLLSEEHIAKAIEYIDKTQEIRDVIFSGGEPLTLSKTMLHRLLQEIYAIKHVEIIRITSRALIYAPEVMDDEMIAMISQFKPLIFIHSFMHPREITPLCIEKLNKLADAGIVMLQQGPILQGINDTTEIIKELYEKLAQHRVIPYYLTYGSVSKGTRHFVKWRKDAKKIMRELENNTSGFCIPHMMTLDVANNKTRSMD